MKKFITLIMVVALTTVAFCNAKTVTLNKGSTDPHNMLSVQMPLAGNVTGNLPAVTPGVSWVQQNSSVVAFNVLAVQVNETKLTGDDCSRSSNTMIVKGKLNSPTNFWSAREVNKIPNFVASILGNSQI